MWLLNARRYELEYFVGTDDPPYAILSHRWSAARDEVAFQDSTNVRNMHRDTWESLNLDMKDSVEMYYHKPTRRIIRKKGWRKIQLCCAEACRWIGPNDKPIDYVWVDTCCIDKGSSAELSEAINSMYRWYEDSLICSACLQDVPAFHTWKTSDWWTRGWTLQELLAPRDVVFYDNRWAEVGRRLHEYAKISEVTGIDSGTLSGASLQDRYSIVYKMFWAAHR